jgi:hypothetical protein
MFAFASASPASSSARKFCFYRQLLRSEAFSFSASAVSSFCFLLLPSASLFRGTPAKKRKSKRAKNKEKNKEQETLESKTQNAKRKNAKRRKKQKIGN